MTTEVGRFKAIKRKTVSLTQEELVTFGSLTLGQSFPLLVKPKVSGLNPAAWAAANRPLVEAHLHRHGAMLWRGFRVAGVEGFEELARAVTPDLLDYKERSSPRSEVGRNVYTSTDHPADQHIRFHNEQSYTHSWPMKLWFYCAQAAAEGGSTPIADGRKVLQLLDPKLRTRFMRERVMYVRNYGYGFGLSWQTAFQTSDRAQVETYCRRAGIDFLWKDGERLRTRQVFDTIVTHPQTGEAVWFEHTAFFHASSLEPSIREALMAEFAEEDLPFNTYYGDGSPIEASALDEIHEAYRQAAVRFRWREGDVLLIDNMLTSHARDPYVGPRRIVVAMAELHASRNGRDAAGREINAA